MPSLLRGAVVVCLGAMVGWSLPFGQCCGADIWSGLTKSFTKPDDVDGMLPENQDTLVPAVIFARLDSGGIFNANSEQNFISTSPEFTEWATDLLAANAGQAIDATNWANLTFATWAEAYIALQHDGQLPDNLIGRNAVVRLVNEDIYLDLKFMSWGIAGAGGFSYLRAEPPAPEPTGDYNGNHVVDAADYTLWRDTLGQMVANLGDGADGDRSGTIDLPDYDHWKARFGEVVPLGAGSQATAAVPEPPTLALWFGGLLTITTYRKLSRRGPGQTF
jgi:hypothetical protein